MTHNKSASEAGGHRGENKGKGDQHRESSWLSEGLCPSWGFSANIILKRPNSQCFLSNEISGLKEVPGITWEHLCHDEFLAPEPRIPEAEKLVNSLS